VKKFKELKLIDLNLENIKETHSGITATIVAKVLYERYKGEFSISMNTDLEDEQNLI